MKIDISTLSLSQQKRIEDNLHAFIANFPSIRIVRGECSHGFYVHVPADAENYIQFCYDISYLDGWLYGCVQGLRRKDMQPYAEVQHP